MLSDEQAGLLVINTINDFVNKVGQDDEAEVEVMLFTLAESIFANCAQNGSGVRVLRAMSTMMQRLSREIPGCHVQVIEAGART